MQAVSPRKFQHWFRSYDSSWFAAAEQQCLNEIHRYQNDIQMDYPESLCSAALTSLMDNSSESVKMTLASSQVLLGMIPAMLSYMGSDLLELGVLSTHRPLLVLLMSIGAPALQIPKVFSSLDVASITDRPPSRSVEAYYRWLWDLPKGWQRLVSSGMYAVVAGAVANNIHTSIYLDQRTVVVWRCGAMYLPLAWAVMGIIPAVLTIGAIRQRHRLPSVSSFTGGGWWRTEATTRNKEDVEMSRRAALLAHSSHEASHQWLGGLLFALTALTALLQLVFGTALLSAVAPIKFFDTLPMVARYMTSSMACRAVPPVEVDGIRVRLQGRK